MEDDFVTPSISFLDNLDFESIYQMQWHEFAYTHFGNDVMRFKLTYIEDSVRIISGKYLYQPQAKLLDKIVSYYVTLYDSVNGIKVVKNALDPRNAAQQRRRSQYRKTIANRSVANGRPSRKDSRIV